MLAERRRNSGIFCVLLTFRLIGIHAALSEPIKRVASAVLPVLSAPSSTFSLFLSSFKYKFYWSQGCPSCTPFWIQPSLDLLFFPYCFQFFFQLDRILDYFESWELYGSLETSKNQFFPPFYPYREEIPVKAAEMFQI